MTALALSAFMAFSVLAFGAVEDWSAAACEVFLFALAAVLGIWGKGYFRMPSRLGAPMFFIVGLVAVGAVQVLPLPVSTWRNLGDERGNISAEAKEAERLLRSEAYRTPPFAGTVIPPDDLPALTPDEPAWRPATYTPISTLAALLALAAAGMLILALERLRDEANGLSALALSIGVLGLVVGVAAVVQLHSGATKVMGFRESEYAGNALGPFINENSGLGFINLSFSFLYYLLFRKSRKDFRLANRMGLWLLALVLAVFHITLLLLRGSGGVLWTALLFPLVILAHALRRRPKLVAGVAAMAAAGFGCLVAAALHFRFTDLHGRIGIWTNALRQNHWLLGSGLASFRDRFPSVMTDVPPSQSLLWIYPENEYFQLFFEAGLPGLILGLGALAYVFSLGWRSIQAHGGVHLLVPALWGEALHAATDFHFHIWPVAASYLVLIAIMTSSLQRQDSQAPPESPMTPPRPDGVHRRHGAPYEKRLAGGSW